MAMPLDYFRRPSAAYPFRAVDPIIDATNTGEAIRQIMAFMSRNAKFTVGVPDTSFFPFSAICKLQITFPTASGGGTGFYIGPNLILTCGHNLFHNVHGRASAVRVRPGQQDSTTWLDSFSVTPSDWDVHPQWEASNALNSSFDLSIIRVNNPPPNNSHFELINYSPAPQVPIAVCGYSGKDVDGTRQHLDIDLIRRLSDDLEMVEYNLQTRAGGSGSPIFAHYPSHDAGSFDPSAIPVMGVHTESSDTHHNKGVLLNPDKIDWARGGGNSSVVSAFSLSTRARKAMIGGLPLYQSQKGSLGGLPLRPVARQTHPVLTQGYAAPLRRNWIVIDQGATGGMSLARRTFGHPTHDMSGKTTLIVRVPNMPKGGKVLWNIPEPDHKARVSLESGGAVTPFVTGTTATLRSTAAGPVAVDCMVKDAAGKTVESNKYWIGSPQFILVAIHPTTDAFFNGIGLGARRAAIYQEMRETMRHLYRNVNIRLVFPGDALPAHLGVAANAAFPGAIEAVPSVYFSETIGSDAIMDPEESHDAGAPTPYGAGILGRNHQPGDQPAPLDRHSVARGLIHRFNGAFAEVNTIQTAAAGGAMTAANLDLAARMYGRLMGENAAHEVGHFMADNFVPHDATGGFMDDGSNRTFTARTGMTANASGPVLTDAGRATINDLSPTLLRVFEEFLPINPPIDQATFRVRGRVGSFARQQATRGWINGGTRSLTDETIHLPGATVLDGWQAQAFIVAIETAFRAAMAANPAFSIFSNFLTVRNVLDACDGLGVTLVVGLSGNWGIGAGGGAGGGIVFAPGRRIGFYGSIGGIVGSIYSATASIQITLINGGPELMTGDGYMVGASVATIGWLDGATFDLPVGAHLVFDGAKNQIGVSFEFGISAGLPVISLIEAYAQATKTATTFRYGQAGHALATNGGSEAYDAALRIALEHGASQSEAEAFLQALFP